jgi:hypothetical protein
MCAYATGKQKVTDYSTPYMYVLVTPNINLHSVMFVACILHN